MAINNNLTIYATNKKLWWRELGARLVHQELHAWKPLFTSMSPSSWSIRTSAPGRNTDLALSSPCPPTLVPVPALAAHPDQPARAMHGGWFVLNFWGSPESMISCVKLTQAKIINTLPQLTFCSSMRGFKGVAGGGTPEIWCNTNVQP